MSNFLSIKELLSQLSKKANKLEKGKLSAEALEEMLENSREIHERITILRYKTLVENKKNNVKIAISKEKEIQSNETPSIEIKESESNFSLNFNLSQEEENTIQTNQKNLLDEINEIKTSINDQYASTTKVETVSEKLKKSKIQDLRKVIGLNQKFLFMNDLFQGEKEYYDKTIDKINECSSKNEAFSYIAEEVENTYAWDSESKSVQDFKELILRKFA